MVHETDSLWCICNLSIGHRPLMFGRQPLQKTTLWKRQHQMETKVFPNILYIYRPSSFHHPSQKTFITAILSGRLKEVSLYMFCPEYPFKSSKQWVIVYDMCRVLWRMDLLIPFSQLINSCNAFLCTVLGWIYDLFFSTILITISMFILVDSC